jgi:hypothetical protein
LECPAGGARATSSHFSYSGQKRPKVLSAKTCGPGQLVGYQIVVSTPAIGRLGQTSRPGIRPQCKFGSRLDFVWCTRTGLDNPHELLKTGSELSRDRKKWFPA